MARRLGAVSLLIVVALSCAYSADRDVIKWVRKRPLIKSIVVEGNSYFSTGDIQGRLYSHENSFWRRFKGDRRIRIQRENISCFIPLTTMIILSILLTVILNVILRVLRK